MEWTLEKISVTKHRIILNPPDAAPIHAAPCRAGPRQRVLEKEEVYQMIKAGVAEAATTEWASPIVFVSKKDGILRFCVNYRRLNAVTERDSYPIPTMDECIESLGEA